MADSVIGALRVLLGVDTAAFSTGLKGAEKSLDSFGASFTAVGKKLAGALSTAAVVADIKKMINAADELGKASQKFGVPVEQLSALKYAAELADVSFESLGKGLGKLSKAMIESAANPAGEAAKNFQALGISATDAGGNVKSTETVFTDIAEKFSTMEDGAAKTALAIKIFGRAGAELIPLLNEGRNGLKVLTDEAKKLGIVVSAETAAKAQEFNDTLKKVHTSVDALALRAAEYLLPALQKLSTMLSGAAQVGSGFDSILKNLITQDDINQIATYAQYWENFLRVFGAAKSIIKAVVGTADEWKAALERGDAAIKQNVESLAALRRSFLSLGQAGAFDSLENLPALIDRVRKGMTDANVATLGAKSAIDSFISSQQKSQAAQQADIQTAFAAVGAREALRVTMEAEAIAAANNLTLTNQQREALKLLSDQAGMYAVQLAGIQMTQQNLTPFQLYQEELRKIDQLYAEQAISAQTAATASAKAFEQLSSAYATAAATALGGFSSLFMAFGAHNKKMFEVGKAFAIAEAVVNTYKAATQALAAPPGPPFSYVYVAGAIAAGLAQVMKITAQKAPTFATGGSLMVGGAGGIDSKMIPIMASPGEKVTVDQNKYGESGGASGRTVTVEGIKTKDYYRGDVLRDLIENINDAISDGYKIKMA